MAGTEQLALVAILAYYHLRNKFFPTGKNILIVFIHCLLFFYNFSLEITEVTEESDESSCVQFTNENGGLFNSDINSKRASNSYQDS